MTVILGLQGLDVKAGAEEIREFFKCLHIPDGGVYILGGSLSEAFIAFTTERDALCAMQYNGHLLKGSKVTLHISTMEELEHKLKSSLKRKRPSPTHLISKTAQPLKKANLLPSTELPLDPRARLTTSSRPHDPRTANLLTSTELPPDPKTAFLLGASTVLQGLQSFQSGNNEAVQTVDCQPAVSTAVSTPGYVRLFGLPASTTKEDICHFLKGLMVQEVIVNVKLGLNHGCLVKFADIQDACDALLFNHQSLGPICVEVRGATEKMWTSALQECEGECEDRVTPQKSALQEQANKKDEPTSTSRVRRRSVDWLQSRSANKTRPAFATTEYVVMVSNLPRKMTKTEIKELFGCPNQAHRNILHLLDKERNRTDTAFLLFDSTDDFDYAVNLDGCHVGPDTIKVSAITKELMKEMIDKTKLRGRKQSWKTLYHKRKSNPLVRPKGTTPSKNLDPAVKTCLFVRNMPADVQESQIRELFHKFSLGEDSIFLLHDSDGKGIGEAVVQFKSQKLAATAQKSHRQDFLEEKVILTRITVKQMEDLLSKNV